MPEEFLPAMEKYLWIENHCWILMLAAMIMVLVKGHNHQKQGTQPCIFLGKETIEMYLHNL